MKKMMIVFNVIIVDVNLMIKLLKNIFHHVKKNI